MFWHHPKTHHNTFCLESFIQKSYFPTVCGHALGDKAMRHNQGNSQIKGSIAHSRNVGGTRNSGEILLSFWTAKELGEMHFQILLM